MEIMKAIRDLEIETSYGVKENIKKGEVIIFLGEIKSMPEHCVFSYKDNIYAGYHSDNFEIDEDDDIVIKIEDIKNGR